MEVTDYIYYLPHVRKVIGTDDPMKIAILVGTYLRYLKPEESSSRYDDGCSSFIQNGIKTMIVVAHKKVTRIS